MKICRRQQISFISFGLPSVTSLKSIFRSGFYWLRNDREVEVEVDAKAEVEGGFEGGVEVEVNVDVDVDVERSTQCGKIDILRVSSVLTSNITQKTSKNYPDDFRNYPDDFQSLEARKRAGATGRGDGVTVVYFTYIRRI